MTKYLLKEFLIKRSVLKSSISKRDNISKHRKGWFTKMTKHSKTLKHGVKRKCSELQAPHVFR